MKPEVVYLGLRISAEGLQTVEEKINTVRRALAPCNVSELRSFLGIVHYYHSFLAGLATSLATLQPLCRKMFNENGRKIVRELSKPEACKEGLTSDSLLVHYNLNRDLGLSCDASSYGLGAVLSHVMDDGQANSLCLSHTKLK